MTKRYCLLLFFTFCLLLNFWLLPDVCAQEASTEFSGIIAGVVLDADEQPVAGALVLLFDSRTGILVRPVTCKPITDDLKSGIDYIRTITDATGRFEINNLAEGSYRVLAEQLESLDKTDELYGARSNMVQICGVQNNIVVPSDRALNINLRPLGDGTVKIPSSGSDSYLVISTVSTLADPALGFMGWGAEFLTNMISVNRMSRREVTVSGLPGGELTLAVFANDNLPGFGAVTVNMEDGKTVYAQVPLVAEWSNGVHTPPEQLRPLYNLAVNDPGFLSGIFSKYDDIPPTSRPDPVIYDEWLSQEIVLDDGLKYILADFLAVRRYIQLGMKDERNIEKDISYQAAFRDLYEKLGEEYPAFELKGIDWEAVGREFLPRAEGIDNVNDFGILCAELVARLEDSHASLLEGRAQLPQFEYPRYHPGFACLEDDRGEAVVYFVTDDSPAAEAGIKPGMTLVSINGRPAREAIDDCKINLKKYSGYSSDRYLEFQAFRFLARQMEYGKMIDLVFTGIDGDEFKCEIPASLDGGYINRLPVPNKNINDSADVDWKRMENGIGYIYVRRVKNDLTESLDTAVRDFRNIRGLIIDVRGNSGGGFNANTAHLNFTLDDAKADPNRPRYTGPIALLIDSRCISAGEGWASWFIAGKRARVFGEATGGASARKKVYTLKNDLYKVRYPVKLYKGFLDRPIERLGLVPDVPLKPNAKDIAEGRDTVLEAAVEYLLSAK